MKIFQRLFTLTLLAGVASAAMAVEPAADPRCKKDVSDVVAKLKSVRSALSVYYGDTQGSYPALLTQLVPKYLPAIPSIFICNENGVVVHPLSHHVDNFTSVTTNNAGGWGYDFSQQSKLWGSVWVNSAGKSPDGKPWIKY